MRKEISPRRAARSGVTARVRKTNNTAQKVVAITPGATKGGAMNAPEPLPESVKAEQRRKTARATAEQPRVLMPGRMVPAGDNLRLCEKPI
jgi:hypothetical protein